MERIGIIMARNAYSMVYVFKTKNHAGTVQCDSVNDARKRVIDCYGEDAIFLARADQVENRDYGIIEF